jgi:hypothetical protein
MKNLKGSIVEFNNGTRVDAIYRVSDHRAGKVNLASLFGSQVFYKGIDESLVKDAEQIWIDRMELDNHKLISRDEKGIHRIIWGQPKL